MTQSEIVQALAEKCDVTKKVSKGLLTALSETAIGENDRTNTLFLAHSPGVVKDLSDQILESVLGAGKANG